MGASDAFIAESIDAAEVELGRPLKAEEIELLRVAREFARAAARVAPDVYERLYPSNDR